jgi:hypothetical protein
MASPQKFVRLSSSAEYNRPVRQDAFGGVALESTYKRTVSNVAADSADMTRRCVSQRREGQRSNMVLNAAKTLSLERVDQIKEECATQFAEETQTKLATQRLQADAAAQATAPLDLPSMDALADTLSKE